MDAQIKRWFNEEVGYEHFLKRAGTGDKQFEPVKLIKCLLVGELNTVYTANSQAITTNYVLFIDAIDIPLITSDDRFTIYDKVIPVVKLNAFRTTAGVLDYWRVYL